MRERFIMSEQTVDSVESPVEEVRKPRTKKVAEENSDTIENISIQEAPETVNDEGQKVISGHKKSRAPRKSNVHVKEDGAIGSHAADAALRKKPVVEKVKKEEQEKIALWSDKNIRWSSVGTLEKGYNIVTKEAAEKWLTRGGIREATPKEIATYYGK